MSKPWVHNAKVVWIYGGNYYPVDECHDVSYALARQYVREHKGDSAYAGGTLKAVSMLQKKMEIGL